MPRIQALPPPPENPERSPPVAVAGEEAIVVEGRGGGPSLEARVSVPPGATRAVVLCHPHPLYGGTMHSAVIVAIAKVLAETTEPTAWLRFNYRGVGESEGSYGHGVGEVDDVRAAIRDLRARAPGASMRVVGYSFGTWVSLRAAAADGGIDRVALVAPAVAIFDSTSSAVRFVRGAGEQIDARIAVFVGDDDGFVDVAEAEEVARSLGASITVLEKSDHYFLRSRRKLAEQVVRFVAG